MAVGPHCDPGHPTAAKNASHLADRCGPLRETLQALLTEHRVETPVLKRQLGGRPLHVLNRRCATRTAFYLAGKLEDRIFARLADGELKFGRSIGWRLSVGVAGAS